MTVSLKVASGWPKMVARDVAVAREYGSGLPDMVAREDRSGAPQDGSGSPKFVARNASGGSPKWWLAKMVVARRRLSLAKTLVDRRNDGGSPRSA